MARAKKHRNEIGIAAQLRPTAKSLIKEALRVYGAAEDALTEAGEQFGDLVSEARAEMTKAQPSRRDKRHKGTS
jgi:vacuolar-type H+-ATPase subunit C/Vma6